jgi:cytochrome c oxidase assembly factor CtaG
MLVHDFLYIIAGFLAAYGMGLMLFASSRFHERTAEVYRHFLRANSTVNKWGMIAFVVSPLFIAFWYVPTNFDAALRSANVNFEMCLSLLVVGSLMFVGSRGLTERARQLAPIIAGKAMGLYGAILLLTPTYVYSVYPLSQQGEAGVGMEVLMLMLDFTVLPIWLYHYFGKDPVSLERQP